MGIEACCNKRVSPDSVLSFSPPNEREIQIQSYHSSNDEAFQDIELKYNFLTYLPLVEYINLLEYYSLETATVPFNGKMKTEYSSKDNFLNYVMSVDELQSFLENQLLKSSTIYEMCGKNELMVTTTKEVMKEMYNSLEMKLNQHYGGDKRNDRITKKSLIPFGILFCVSNVVGKIKLIFDLFKDENEAFVKSESLDEFLITTFLLCSYCMVSARRKISKINSSLPELSNQDLIKIIGVCELKDCQNLLKIFNETFFEENSSFNWLEFKEKFENKEKGFQWILSPKKNKKKLEENNV